MSLNSWEFAVLGACAMLVVPVTSGWWRSAIFLALNLGFAWSYWGVAGTPVALGFCLLGYLSARLVQGRGTAVLAASLTLLTAVFACLRGYTLGGSAAPLVYTVGGVAAFIGISFLFFKMVHVVVDAANGSIEDLSFWKYLNYCLNFTTMLMGPIQRFQDFAAQWDGRTSSLPWDFEANVDAANRVLRGLVKAFALAPLLAPFALRPGLPIEHLGGGELVLKAYAFYVYLYLDFSGYCDVMIGVGGLMGLRPPENFDFPFLSRNLSAYWLRVHRSLTLWLTDYVFTPAYKAALGVRPLARHPFLTLAASLMLTMFVAGAWHGTAWHFVAFGLLHGTALVAMRGYEQVMTSWIGRARFRRIQANPVITAAAVFLTYNFTSFAYVFFVLDIHESLRLFGRLATIESW